MDVRKIFDWQFTLLLKEQDKKWIVNKNNFLKYAGYHLTAFKRNRTSRSPPSLPSSQVSMSSSLLLLNSYTPHDILSWFSAFLLLSHAPASSAGGSALPPRGKPREMTHSSETEFFYQDSCISHIVFRKDEIWNSTFTFSLILHVQTYKEKENIKMQNSTR